MNTDQLMNISTLDIEYCDSKLKDYKVVSPIELKVGDHIRYTSNRYKLPGRKCNYVIIKKIIAEGFLVNGYTPDNKNEYPDWLLDPGNKFKKIKFYIKKEEDEIEKGICVYCMENETTLGYDKCLDCHEIVKKNIAMCMLDNNEIVLDI